MSNTHHLINDWVPKCLSFHSLRHAASAGKTSRSPNLTFFSIFNELAFLELHGSGSTFRFQGIKYIVLFVVFRFLVGTREWPGVIPRGLRLCASHTLHSSLFGGWAAFATGLVICFQGSGFRV